jgi:hypothetical protein
MEGDMIIVNRDRLQEKDLRDLFSGRLTAVRIKDYVEPRLCPTIVGQLVKSKSFGAYAITPDVHRFGQALGETPNTPESRDRYTSQATSWISEMRSLCAPIQLPVDRLRLELDETWPTGAILGSVAGKKLFAGLTQYYSEGSSAEPHQDVFDWDEICPRTENSFISAQLAGNIYLAVPESGGRLTIWPEQFDRSNYQRRRNPASWGISREQLSAPIAELDPCVGELILFNAGQVHAVERIDAGSRVTTSVFIGFRDETSPLFLWS